jgi:hypothetical protein
MNRTYLTQLDDEQIDELLAYTPSYTPQNAESIRKMFLQKTAIKRKPVMRVLFAAAIIVIIFSFSLTALAVSGIIDFGSLFNSIFANPETTPYIISDDMINITQSGTSRANESIADIIANSSDDLLIEPIAGFIDGLSLYLQLKITSQNDNPIPDMLYIIDGTSIRNIGDVAVSHIDEKTAIISFESHILYDYKSGDDVIINFNALSSLPIVVENRPGSAPAEPPPEPIDSNEESYVTPIDNAVTFYGDWEIRVSGENVLESRFIDCSVLGLSAQVRISATSLEVQLYSDENEPFDVTADSLDNEIPLDLPIESGFVTVMLTDGRIVELMFNGVIFDTMTASFMYSMEFVNPADVVSIDFYGNEIMVFD